jgi:hypothetical protein
VLSSTRDTVPVKPPSILCIIHAQLESAGDRRYWIGEVEHVQTGQRRHFVTVDQLLQQVGHFFEEELRQVGAEPARPQPLIEE